MPSYEWNFDVIWTYRGALLSGLRYTIELSLLSCVIGTILGLFLAIGRRAKRAWLRIPCIVSTELLLALPLLVLLIWIYYCLPLVNRSLALDAFSSGVVALSLNLSAFVGETLRAGLDTIPRAYTDAAQVLGLSKWHAFRGIVLPLAIRRVTPPLLAQYITTIKLSSLASVIAVYEFLHSAENLIAVTFRPLEVYTAVAVGYLIVILPLSTVVRYLEKRIVVRT